MSIKAGLVFRRLTVKECISVTAKRAEGFFALVLTGIGIVGFFFSSPLATTAKKRAARIVKRMFESEMSGWMGL